MSECKRVTVLGGGAFGTAMAAQTGRKGIETRMWVREGETREAINTKHENTAFLPGAELAKTITAYEHIEESFEGTDVCCTWFHGLHRRVVVAHTWPPLPFSQIVLIVIPTPFLRAFVQANREKFPVDVPIVCCSKGIEKVMRRTRVKLHARPGM